MQKVQSTSGDLSRERPREDFKEVAVRKSDSTYDILGIRSAELNMMGNKNDGPPSHKLALDAFFEQVVSGVGIHLRGVSAMVQGKG